MTETKKLVMVFKNSVGKNVSISIDDPKDNITETEIKTTMELIVEKNIFRKMIMHLLRLLRLKLSLLIRQNMT